MIKPKISNKEFWDNKATSYTFLLQEDYKSTSELDKIEEYCPNYKEILKRYQFEAKLGQTYVLTGNCNKKLVDVIFIGLGKLDKTWEDSLENLRRALGSLVHLLKKKNIKDTVLGLPDSDVIRVDEFEILRQSVVAMHMADYEFNDFKTVDKKEKFESEIILSFPEVGSASESVVQEANIIGKYVNSSRNMVDQPGNIMTPTKLSEEAKRIASETGLKYKVFGREEASKLGMGGFCAVDSGSDQDGKFIVMEHNVSKNVPTIALVGKGVTFDTGGVSLKPAQGMTGMKYDMSGAATVINTIGAIAKLGLNINVIAIVPSVENMPSGKSCRQDDIITFMNGKTAEIVNTDAEGRLILADGLCYAEKNFKPDFIIDVATLTGACVMALGHAYSAVMTRNDDLSKKLVEAGSLTGDKLWRLPLHDDYKPANKSDVADISNCGVRAYGAGSITAGLFLENFVEKTPWAHLDIAGTADGVPGVNYLGKGGTGTCIRMLIEFTKSLT